MRRLRFPAILAAIALIAGVLTIAPVAAPSASAADGRDFQAGNIISDSLFYDGGTMNAGEVQNFLNAARPGCRAGYTCLKDFAEATASRAAVAGRCAAYAGSGRESAASIIAKVGAACGISQKVLIVMLEKEQSLITDDWPSARQYRSAMGYGCPDTADCDTNYYGFFNQVYAAALQFKNYQANPTRWNHVPGRINAVRYNPNAACGSSSVFIQNYATAGLYNYTPYQPNASALANLYGSGDGCGAYGNRNFWRLYTDWFGSTTGGSSLVKSAASAAIYLVAGDQKYYVPDQATLSAFASLGGVATVSQAYLDRYTTVGNATRIVRAPSGAIYLVDAGLRVGFTSCEMVLDYGGSCTTAGYTQLTDAQIALFVEPAARVTPVYATTAGARYYVTRGTKREIVDATAQALAGIPADLIVLTEAGVANLADGAPILRDSIYLGSRGTGGYSFVSGATKYPVQGNATVSLGLPAKSGSALWPRNYDRVVTGGTFPGAVAAPGGAAQVLSTDGRYAWSVGTPIATVPASQDFVNSYPALGTIGEGSTVTGNTGAVYLVADGILRPFASWLALISTQNTTSPSWISVAPNVLGQVPQGNPVLAPGTLVRSPESAAVFLIDGTKTKVPVSSFEYTNAIGISGVDFIPQAQLDAYATSPNLQYGVTCNGVDYVSAGGKMHKLTPELKALYPAVTYVTLSAINCQPRPIGNDAGRFMRTPNGTIYYLDAGTKRPISSMARFAELGGTSSNYLDVNYPFAGLFADGPVA
ncbi:hypothetical protein PlfCFBP13513_13765 [Plantibacter flavus]|uniref:hypothetical protein n=1 Tax=Plantibacter TaxID=190323 RepID=UPI0010C21945|nr:MULTISPECIES: hypothetical protein [Plantibacter]MBD8103560.1 hypothetical protein [Plantibacter sp. CFBP 8775]TKJ96520.1 hypothetical protein PlfCFBP13513_13765 [Plantibacter flavus]